MGQPVLRSGYVTSDILIVTNRKMRPCAVSFISEPSENIVAFAGDRHQESVVG